MTKQIIHIAENCYGCRTCELACSFHLNKKFQPSKSSINVIRDHVNGIWSWSLDDTCDLCTNESEPLCVKFCQYDAIAYKEQEVA